MTSPVSRIALLLAASDISSYEIRQFERWMENNSHGRLVKLIEKLRDLADASPGSGSVIPQMSRIPDEVVPRVQRLLIDEGGLSKGVAMRLIDEALRDEGYSVDVSSNNRISFARWLDRVSSSVSPSVLLHIATKLRNERVKSSDSDWPLKSE